MDKTDIIEKLNQFPYDCSGYWVVTGGAMVLYGIKDHTGDLDLGCTKEMADALERDGYLFKVGRDGKRFFRYGDTIEIFEDWLYDSVAAVEGIPLISLEGLLEMKRDLGREKDMLDIQRIKDHMKLWQEGGSNHGEDPKIQTR